jgi:hypothetical protein
MRSKGFSGLPSMLIHGAQRCISAMHDEIDPLFPETPLELGMEPELAIEQLRWRAVRFDIEVDVAAAALVVDA